MTQLILGTAQFGTGYGVTNSVGRLSDGMVGEICAAATDGGINVFDCSSYYGDAQKRLGQLIPAGEQPLYISKFGLEHDSALDLDEFVHDTLNDLKVNHLAALLFHRVEDLRDPRAALACEILREARTSGILERIGVSIYDHSDLEAALEVMPDLDIVQLPGNLIDRRLLDHPLLVEFRQRGGTVHVRSAYLQGLLLSTPEQVPKYLAGLRPIIKRLDELAESRGVSLIEILLGFLKHHPLVDAVVIGALSVGEMNETLAAWNRAEAVDVEMPVLDVALLDPRKWQNQRTKLL